MTGILGILAGDGPYPAGGGTPPAGLSCTISFSAGAGPFNVSAASGNLSAQGYGIIQAGAAGGAPPYIDTLTFAGDPSGKISGVDNGLGADTISYNGFAMNEVESCYLQYNVTDSQGAHASARFPAASLLTIKRTS